MIVADSPSSDVMKTTENLVELFNALADPTRLRLLNLMREGEVCVCFFVEILKEGQPKISRHLAYLRNAGIVEARREGKWMHYRIVEPKQEAARRILAEVMEVIATDTEMRRDRERLTSVCCTPRVPAALQGAPIPIWIPTTHTEKA